MEQDLPKMPKESPKYHRGMKDQRKSIRKLVQILKLEWKIERKKDLMKSFNARE